MKSLYNALVGIKEEQEDTNEDTIQINKYNEDFETLHYPNDQMINQIHRKTKFLKEFKIYIENADENTIYFKHIINTEIYECNNKRISAYVVYVGLFGGLNEGRITINSDDYFGALLDL